MRGPSPDEDEYFGEDYWVENDFYKIPPNLPLPRGGVYTIPSFYKGG
jgi:hypothetical protein